MTTEPIWARDIHAALARIERLEGDKMRLEARVVELEAIGNEHVATLESAGYVKHVAELTAAIREAHRNLPEHPHHVVHGSSSSRRIHASAAARSRARPPRSTSSTVSR